MTNKLEIALEQVGQVFLEMAKEIKNLKEEIADLQVLANKHESMNHELGKIFNTFKY